MNIKITGLVRPSLTIEEIKQDDGSLKPGRYAWSMVEFTTDLDLFTIYGKHDSVTLEFDGGEKWQFIDCRVAPTAEFRHKNKTNKFAITYEKVIRVG